MNDDWSTRRSDDLQIDKALGELDFGRIEGKPMAEAEELFPSEIRDFKTDPIAHPMPGGELFFQVSGMLR